MKQAEQQLKDLKELSYDNYMKKWDTNKQANICSSTYDSKDCTATTTIFNGRKEEK